MSNAARKARKRLQRNLRDFGHRSQAAALWEPEQKVPTGPLTPKEGPLSLVDMRTGLALARALTSRNGLRW